MDIRKHNNGETEWIYANEKMIELGYKAIYNDIDPNLLKQIEWFGHLTSGKTHQDFFAGRVTSYSKSTADWDDL